MKPKYDENVVLAYGLYGWYWFTNGKYRVVITNHRILNKYFNPHKDFKYPSNSEDTVTIKEYEFDVLRIPRLIKVMKQKQDELREWHDSKYGPQPKNHPCRLSILKGNSCQKLKTEV